MQENRQKPIEESLPRNPQEGQAIPDARPQVNRVVVLETGSSPHFNAPPPPRPRPVPVDHAGVE